MLCVGIVKSLVQAVLPHCHFTVATITNLPNEQKGTHQDGACVVVQQRDRFPACRTFVAHVLLGSTGFSDANDGAFC